LEPEPAAAIQCYQESGPRRKTGGGSAGRHAQLGPELSGEGHELIAKDLAVGQAALECDELVQGPAVELGVS
jgi:hypothetical protein